MRVGASRGLQYKVVNLASCVPNSFYSCQGAVEHLHVELGEHEARVHTGLPQIPLRGCVHHVTDLEALDGLVLSTNHCAQKSR